MLIGVAERQNELNSMGLTQELLHRALIAGESLRDSATIHDPPTRGGFEAWAESVRVLRDELVPLGWTVDDRENVCRVVAPGGTFAIAVLSGDEHTGSRTTEPTTKYRKGAALTRVVEINQEELFPEIGMVPGSPPSGRRTWFLLRYRTDDDLRAELSLPELIDDGRVTRWAARIPLETVAVGAQSTFEITPTEPVDVPVSRRS